MSGREMKPLRLCPICQSDVWSVDYKQPIILQRCADEDCLYSEAQERGCRYEQLSLLDTYSEARR